MKRHYLKNKIPFSEFLIPFLKCALNLENFEQKDEYPSPLISRTFDSERGSYLNV